MRGNKGEMKGKWGKSGAKWGEMGQNGGNEEGEGQKWGKTTFRPKTKASGKLPEAFVSLMVR